MRDALLPYLRIAAQGLELQIEVHYLRVLPQLLRFLLARTLQPMEQSVAATAGCENDALALTSLLSRGQ